MTRHVFWPAVLVVVGVAVALFVLLQVPPEVPTVEPPVTGGPVVEGVVGYFELINPILAPRVVQGNPVEQDLSALVFDGLTSLDATGQITGALATGWEASEDGTVYEFRLREDVVWHDGAPFGADDVVFTIQAMQDLGFRGDGALRELWRTVVVEKQGEHAVRFTLSEPFPSFLYYTTIGLLPAHLLGNVPADALPESAFSTQQPVGTGMFEVESISPDRVILAPNRSYWGAQPSFDGLEFWFYADETGLLTDFEGGAIHAFHPSRSLASMALAGTEAATLFSAPSAGYGIVYLNLAHAQLPFFGSKEVRQALLYGLDRQRLIDQALGGLGVVADSPILPMLWAHDPSVRRYRYDRERAIGLLDESGWLDTDGDRIRDKEGQKLAFDLLTGDDPALVKMAEEMARQWLEVGVEARVRSENDAYATGLVRSRAFQAALIEVGLTADPDPYPLWHSTQATRQGQNFSGFSNEEADLVMERGRLSLEQAERIELYHSFQQIFAEEVPSLLVYYPVYTYLVGDRVQGVQLSPLLHTIDRFRTIADWTTESAPASTAGGELDNSSQ